MKGNYHTKILAVATGLAIGYGANNTAYASDKAQPPQGNNILWSILSNMGNSIESTLDGAWDTSGKAINGLGRATGNTLKEIGGELGKAGRAIDRYFDAADHRYVTLDNALYRSIPEGTNRGKQIGHSISLLPGNYIVTVQNGVYSIAKWPGAAMDKAKEEKKSLREKRPRQPIERPERKMPLALVQVPLDATLGLTKGAIELTKDTGRFIKYSIQVGADGTIKCIGQTIGYAVKHPLDTTTRVLGTAVILDTIHDSSSSGGGAGEESPPDPPTWPPPP